MGKTLNETGMLYAGASFCCRFSHFKGTRNRSLKNAAPLWSLEGVENKCVLDIMIQVYRSTKK